MRKCRFCHKEIQDASRVCEHYGKDLVSLPAAAPSPPPLAEPHGRALLAPDPVISTDLIARVSVVDINMPFASMVGFMVKWALAAVPAFVILFVIFAILGVLFGGLFRGCVG